MLIIESPLLLRQQTRLFRQQDMSIALVVTKGNLHPGQLSVVETARANADVVVVSIFVNPMQFQHPADLARYPRTLQQDCEKLSRLGTSVVFAPRPEALYPADLTRHAVVDLPQLALIPQYARKATEIRAIATLLCKLFNLVLPDSACFGEKHLWQLYLVRQLVADMEYDIDIISVPVLRDENGLPVSSQYRHLTPQQRTTAACLYPVMQQLARYLAAGERDLHSLRTMAQTQLTAQGLHNIELHVRDADNLTALSETSLNAAILLTAWLEGTLLTDNLLQPLWR